ncbi:MAG: GNAT family N-acetyltransferase, partial [Deltaproteobacteria bacterium]|nr:GNAT family N-acetyltransferase [Deltaproteobacteria bacterium]
MPKPKCRIFRTPNQVEPYVDRVVDLADANRKALGFLQKAVFREQASRGRLWIAVTRNSGECIGYLLFGGRYPVLRVFQLLVKKSYRKLGVGEQLITSLVGWGEKYSYLLAAARVASDLPANGFWERVGFSLVRQETGGESTGRMINVRVRELKTPSLLDWMSFETSEAKAGIQHIQLAHRPIINDQTYVLDLNIFFDITKRRVHRMEAARLISTGLSQEARVFVTPEFSKELQRNTHLYGMDPILEFASALPVLPEVPAVEIDELRAELEALVFPAGISSGRHH